MLVISSRSNPIVHEAINLKDKKYIREKSLCLVESEKIVSELNEQHKITTIIVQNDKVDKFKHILDSFDGQIVYVTSGICEYIADSTTPSGIFGFAKISFNNTDIVSGNAIILDNLQDPGNFGSIVRSAYAFNFKDIFLIDSVFPYSFKVIRASMGYVFNVRIHDITYNDLKRLKHENDLHLIVADMDGVPVEQCNFDDKKVALVIGNEGNGISKTIKEMKFDTVSIPMQNNVESLNASISASILMHYISNKEN